MPTLPIAATSTVMPSLPLPPTLSRVCVLRLCCLPLHNPPVVAHGRPIKPAFAESLQSLN